MADGWYEVDVTRELRARRHKRTAFAMFCLLVTAAVFSFFSWRDADPHVSVPTPVMPNPNAYDYFVRAGNLAKEELGEHPDYSHELSLAEKRLVVAQNHQALEILREGFAYPFQSPPARSFRAKLPHFSKFRSLTRILAMTGEVDAADGHFRDAARDDVDAVQLGIMVPRGGQLIGMLTGIACESIGRKQLWKLAPHLNAAQSREAASRLETLEASRVSYASTLREEQWCGEASLAEVMKKPGWRNAIAEESGEDKRAQLEAWLHLLPWSKGQIIRHYSHYMDVVVAYAELPYSRTQRCPEVPPDPICQIMLPLFGQANFLHVVARTENGLLATTLALRAYRLEHHRYPARLLDLAPGCLHKIPMDPFDAAHTFRYRQKGSSYILYSVGPDGVDNGGTPVTDPNAPPDRRGSIKYDSRGDIVAGLNLH